MAEQEARSALSDVDYLLEHDAVAPDLRERLLRIRRLLEHVQRTGHFPHEPEASPGPPEPSVETAAGT